MSELRVVPKSVDVIIVNYRTPELTLQAVESVLKEECLNKVIVVDNSAAEPAERFTVPQQLKDVVELVVAPTNIGFGPANNLGAKKSQASYLLLLNSDAILQPSCADVLAENLAQSAEVGVLAPAVYLPDGRTLQPDALGYFPTPFTIITQQTKRLTDTLTPDWVTGAAMMLRREEFLKLGGFNEQIFFYYEDVELCRRYKRAGYQIKRCKEVGVIHLGGQSRRSTVQQKDMYYKGQDSYLRLIGTPGWQISLVRWVRKIYRLIRGV